MKDNKKEGKKEIYFSVINLSTSLIKNEIMRIQIINFIFGKLFEIIHNHLTAFYRKF
mgnify:CR=1 FL=1